MGLWSMIYVRYLDTSMILYDCMYTGYNFDLRAQAPKAIYALA
jgi:hypothetical protein